MVAEGLGPPGCPQMQRRRIYDAEQPGMGQRPRGEGNVTRFKYPGQKYRCGLGHALPQRLVRPRRRRRVEAQERGQHAVEALGLVADQKLEQAWIVEPGGRLVGQAFDPRIGRVNVFEAEPADGGWLEIVVDVQIRRPSQIQKVDEPGESRRVGTARGRRSFDGGKRRRRACRPGCCRECTR